MNTNSRGIRRRRLRVHAPFKRLYVAWLCRPYAENILFRGGQYSFNHAI